jgi:Cu-Zn family superoxide dismutase
MTRHYRLKTVKNCCHSGGDINTGTGTNTGIDLNSIATNALNSAFQSGVQTGVQSVQQSIPTLMSSILPSLGPNVTTTTTSTTTDKPVVVPPGTKISTTVQSTTGGNVSTGNAYNQTYNQTSDFISSMKDNMKDHSVTAICWMNMGDNGYVTFEQLQDKTIIRCFLKNLSPGDHGMHIHNSGNILKTDCSKVCDHYNPFGKEHGALNSPNAHVGDLGNIHVQQDGQCFQVIESLYVRLTGPYPVMGRSLIIHKDADDLGLGNYPDSKKSGHSGDKISCGAIVYNSC